LTIYPFGCIIGVSCPWETNEGLTFTAFSLSSVPSRGSGREEDVELCGAAFGGPAQPPNLLNCQ